MRCSFFLRWAFLALLAGSIPIAAPWRAVQGGEKPEKPAVAPKPTLEEAYRQWYKGFSSTRKEDQLQALRSMLPTKKDIEYLFPKHSAKLWPIFEKDHAFLMDNVDKIVKEMMRHGSIKAVIPEDVRKDEFHAKSYKRLLEIIPKDVGVFEINVKYDKGSGGGGTYLFWDSRWFFIRGLDAYPELLDELK